MEYSRQDSPNSQKSQCLGGKPGLGTSPDERRLKVTDNQMQLMIRDSKKHKEHYRQSWRNLNQDSLSGKSRVFMLNTVRLGSEL